MIRRRIFTGMKASGFIFTCEQEAIGDFCKVAVCLKFSAVGSFK